MRVIVVYTQNSFEYPFDMPYLSGLGHVESVFNKGHMIPEIGRKPYYFDSVESANEYINSIGRADMLLPVVLPED
jgi:hypothetical protein